MRLTTVLSTFLWGGAGSFLLASCLRSSQGQVPSVPSGHSATMCHHVPHLCRVMSEAQRQPRLFLALWEFAPERSHLRDVSAFFQWRLNGCKVSSIIQIIQKVCIYHHIRFRPFRSFSCTLGFQYLSVFFSCIFNLI